MGTALSIKIMSWVWDHSPYEGKALLLHLALADFANDAGEAWPSQPTLAKKARCTERYVRDAVATMEQDGYLSVSKPSNGRDSHRYTLTNGPRNSVPPRNSGAGREEVSDRERGNPLPKNRQEPSKNLVRCPYCNRNFDTSKPHNCPANNMLMR